MFLLAGSSVTAAPDYIFVEDFESLDCTQDRDGDRLNDCVETGTGIFATTSSTGTQRTIADTDGDGLRDGDEVLGTTGGLDLPGLGTNPLRKDLLVEIDWVIDNYTDPSPNCDVGSHRPSATAVQLVTDMFSKAPVANEQGASGINLIIDYGQGGAFVGGNLLVEQDGVIFGDSSGAEYEALKAGNFAANRQGYFRYGIMAHRFDFEGNKTYTGHGALNGDEFITALYCAQGNYNQATAIAHELGHNLGLEHGGFEACGHSRTTARS